MTPPVPRDRAGGPLPGRTWLRLAARAAALVPALSLYYASDWAGLRAALRAMVSGMFALQGRAVTSFDGGPDLLLVVDGSQTFSVTPACTYLDLLLVSAPFAWRFGRPLARNAAALAACAGALLALNLVRIAAAVGLALAGLPWETVHHGADVALHVAWIAGLVLSSARADARDAGPREAGAAGHPARERARFSAAARIRSTSSPMSTGFTR